MKLNSLLIQNHQLNGRVYIRVLQIWKVDLVYFYNVSIYFYYTLKDQFTSTNNMSYVRSAYCAHVYKSTLLLYYILKPEINGRNVIKIK